MQIGRSILPPSVMTGRSCAKLSGKTHRHILCFPSEQSLARTSDFWMSWSASHKLTAAHRFRDGLRPLRSLLHTLKARQFSSRRLIRAKLTGCPCGRSSAKNAAFACGRHELRDSPKSHKIKNRRAHRWNDEGHTRDSLLHFLWDGPKR